MKGVFAVLIGAKSRCPLHIVWPSEYQIIADIQERVRQKTVANLLK